jgi:hypothetical protein
MPSGIYDSGMQDGNRKALRRRYAGLYREVEAILFRYDPVGIKFEENTPPDEYDPEVSTILPRAWRAAFRTRSSRSCAKSSSAGSGQGSLFALSFTSQSRLRCSKRS